MAVGAVSTFAVAIAINPAAARHSPHRVHGLHHSHEQDYTPPYADIVLDANSGKVLHADKADELRHPASLTKIMTLYLLFEKLESGQFRLDSQIPVSEHASDQAPTKLGLKSGQTIEIEDAIRGLVTKSANDAAVAIAEAIGGTEHDFAEMMTAKAHALGMTHTVYRNASGLPNDEQVTTARDQAMLGRVIQDRFPHYYRYFSTPSFTWQGETVRNHNHLLGRLEGMDGIKTGYTQASGFNLVASVRRDDRHIVAVVLGGSSAGSRDARMRSLVEDYISNAAPQRILTASAAAAKADAMRRDEARKADEARRDEARLNALVRSATAEPPPNAARPDAPNNTAPPNNANGAPGSGTYSVASAATDPIRPVTVRTLNVKMAPAQIAALAPTAETPPPPPASAPPPATDVPTHVSERDLITDAIRAAVQDGNAKAGNASEGNATTGNTTAGNPDPGNANPPPGNAPPAAATTVATATTAPPTNPPATPPPSVHTGWMVQVGAFDVEQEARDRLNLVQTKLANLLKHATAFTEAVTSGDKTLYRARFAGIQRDQADAICRQLKRNDIVCMTIKN